MLVKTRVPGKSVISSTIGILSSVTVALQGNLFFFFYFCMPDTRKVND